MSANADDVYCCESCLGVFTMSTMTPTQPPSRWIQKRLARLTVDQYEAMVAKVAASSVAVDRQMAEVYGAAGIAVYWILNLRARQVEVYTLLKKRRGASRYGNPRIYKMGQSVPVVIEGVNVGRIAVADIIPRNS